MMGRRKPKSTKKLGGDWQTCWFGILVIAGPAVAVGAVAAWGIVEAVS